MASVTIDDCLEKIYNAYDIYLDYIPEGESDIHRDRAHNAKLFEEKKKNNEWSQDFIRFPWLKVL